MNDKDRLNELGIQWMEVKAYGSLSERRNMESEIFTLIPRLFPGYADAWGTFFIEDWYAYTSEKGNLYQYCSNRLAWRSKDQFQKDNDIRRRKVKNNETGGYDRIGVRPLSLQEKTDESDEAEYQELLEDTSSPALDDLLMANSTMVQLITQMLRLPQDLQGKANNPQRINYYRMFFTDSIANIAQNQEGISSLDEREKDLFSVLQLPFLDFFQERICRTVAQLRSSCTKAYGRMVEGRPMEDPGHPLPNDVYCAYLETRENTKVGSSALSNQRASYKKFLEELIC